MGYKNKFPILIGCEESGTITTAFREAGYECFSCDLEPTRGNPDWHYQEDVKLTLCRRINWSLVILHPPCTALALCGNKHYGKRKHKNDQRIESVKWTLALWDFAKQVSKRVVLENPATWLIFPHLRKVGAKVQYIQPWQFGHGETKKTGLALHNVPPLVPTDIVEGREQRVWKMGPGPDRARDRSVTYSGISDAMVDQLGSLL